MTEQSKEAVRHMQRPIESIIQRIKSCGKPITGRTVALQEDWFTLLGLDFWQEPVVCGEKKTLRQKDAVVICWSCAFKQQLVSQSAEQHDRNIDAFLKSV
jgi:hypothetical protein